MRNIMVVSPWISSQVSLLARRLGMSSLCTSNYKLLFPGQGSQYVGMTSGLSQPLSPSLQLLFDTCNEVFGTDVRQMMLSGPQDALSNTINCQPAVVIASLAAYKSLDSKIIDGCSGMAGFSVGEITALIAAEAISLKQGLLLVKERAKAMQHACRAQPSGMLTVIGLDEEKLQETCHRIVSRYQEPLYIANHLFSYAYTVSGTHTGLGLFKTIAIEEGAMSIKDVEVGGGFHCKLMQPAVTKFKKVLDSVNVSMPRVPVYSNVTARPYASVEEIRDLLTRQLVTPVLWKQIMGHMIEGDSRDETEEEEEEEEEEERREVKIKTKGEKGQMVESAKREGDKRIEKSDTIQLNKSEGEEMKFVEVGPGKQLKFILGKIDKTSFRNCSNIDI